MKNSNYRIIYLDYDKTQFSTWVTADNIQKTVVELLKKHYKIIGIEIV